jgi:transposase-like protein/DNA-directed RNA polymerase subunit RPC12/RpoP
MKLLDFYKEYPTEQSCRKAFKKTRENEGIRCSKCGNTTHYWKKNREEWECKKCSHRTRLRVGTVMENSKLPFQYWFIAMHLLTSTKKSISAKEMQRQLGHKRYEPIWAMMHKLRLVMGIRDANYTLSDEVELDEGFFETVSITRDKTEPLKRGRGSQKQTTVLVSVESETITDDNIIQKYKIKKRVGYLKMKVIDSLKKKDISDYADELIDTGTCVVTDGSNSYNDLHENYNHKPKVVSKKEIVKHLPWVHIAISNAKRLLLNTYHRIDDDFLQSYLNEFCFKFNRRYFDDLFNRLLITSASYRWNYLGD